MPFTARPQPARRLRWSIAALALALLFAVPIQIHSMQLRELRRVAATIKPGDAESHALTVLGTPILRTDHDAHYALQGITSRESELSFTTPIRAAWLRFKQSLKVAWYRGSHFSAVVHVPIDDEQWPVTIQSTQPDKRVPPAFVASIDVVPAP